LIGLLVLGPAGLASAGGHTWDTIEVFSDSSGQIQFVELWESGGGASEFAVPGKLMSSGLASFTISGASLAPVSTANKFYLLATQAFADLPGAPTPDAIIPPGSIPFFSTTGDFVSYGGLDTWTFGAVPTDGVRSLTRGSAGDTGSVDLSAPPAGPTSAPMLSGPTQLLRLATLLTAGIAVVRRRAPLRH